jgi:hypothetical protein
MDQKMKNFDRNIEQLMNESAVTPPFGMWNRIAGELEAEAMPVAASVNSPIPQRTILGFIAGAALIGASLITAYLVDNTSKPETITTVNTTITTPALSTPQVTTPANVEAPAVVPMVENKPVVRSSKPTTIAKAVEEKTTPAEVASAAPVMSNNSEVMVPSQEIAENNMSNEPYYFPAIDMGDRQSKPVEKIGTPVAKTKAVVKTDDDDNEREVVSNNDRVKKFRPKKHRSFSYGKIIRRK